jgi:hypothetical protein
MKERQKNIEQTEIWRKEAEEIQQKKNNTLLDIKDHNIQQMVQIGS